jgi:hypothetical protein
MNFLNNFDINHVADEGDTKRDFGAVPAGHYRVVCERAEEAVTKSTSTEACKFAWRISEGEFSGQWLWDQMNVDHPKDGYAAREQNRFREMCKATNTITPKTMDDFPGCECVVDVKVRPAQGQYGESNEIKRYLPPVPKDSATPVEAAPKRAGNSGWEAPA